MTDNLILLTDSYKVTHWLQLPPGTEYLHSYLESRGAAAPLDGQRDTVFFGLQYALMRYLSQGIFYGDLEEAYEVLEAHFGDPDLFNRKGWLDLLQKHAGALPVVIRAVPEGTVVPLGNALVTVENTDPAFPWLTNYIETLLVLATWYPITVATLSRRMKALIGHNLDRTGDRAGLDFKLHDFGFRGVSSVESAAIGGLAHLVNFLGTDTLAALSLGRDFYEAGRACGHSIPAAEHSTVISWPMEQDAYRNMIAKFGSSKSGLYAVVSDSYDIHHAVQNIWGRELLAEVQGAPNTLVVRPDSGIPHQVVVDVISSLMGRFGYSTNAKGYNVLNPKVRVIQGDGIDLAETERILACMEVVRQSGDNVAFGMGGGLLQKVNRDTLKFAFKASHIAGGDRQDVDCGTLKRPWSRDISKRPATDLGKASKAGRLKLVRVPVPMSQTFRPAEEWRTVRVDDPAYADAPDQLVEVFRDGRVTKSWTLAEVRERAKLEAA